MKISITKKQYWDLMRAVYMADWMANAICEAGMKEDKGIKDIKSYILSFAKEMGYDEYAVYDEELKRFCATFDMDNEPSTRALIDRYDDHSFWDELSDRLGERDFFRKYSKKEIKGMSQEDRFMKHMECEIVWEDECEDYGIERLEIQKDGEN